ncbi:MAG: hypothetical protein J3Q66DRAFT_282476 [Benniella sp.]|nr:MAG: hypothetical protein J3Q66DRAFT_282476 [Benniella sp.]
MKKAKKPLIPLYGAYNASVIVGRGSQATLNLGRINRQVSRRHAVVQWNESVGSFQITVLGQNGVRINGAGYPSGEEARLKDGDIVDLVGVKMVFRAPNKKSTAPTKPEVVDKNTKQKATSSVKEKDHEGKASVASPKKEKSKTTKDSDPIVTKSPKVKDVPPSTTESTKAKESHQQPSTTTKTAKAAAPKTLAAQPVASTMDYTEMIIDTLVFARKKKSMTLSELFDEMIASQPSLMATQTSEEIKEQMIKCLSASRCVGKITRKGKDANNKPLENQWYYIPEYDYNTMRKQTRQEVMPSARACTLKDKQYFFKMPPKLPYHRKSTSPYAVKSSSVRPIKESSKLSTNADVEDDEEVSSSSSSSESEEDVEDHLQTKRKRSAMVPGHLDKKRKAQPASSTTVDSTNGKRVEKEEEEDDDDGTQNDSLDDLSDISGLSD